MRTRRRRRILIAALLALAAPALLAATGDIGPAQAQVQAPAPALRAWTMPSFDLSDPAFWLGWGNPSYSADFTQTLDTTKWNVYNYPTATNPASKLNATVSGGALHLTGQLDGPVSNGKPRDEGAGVASVTNLTYGRWEARIRVAPGAGYGAAMTLWPHSEKWPDDGEIDVTEVHDPSRTKAAQIVHLGPTNRQVGTTSMGDWTGWHVYGVDWEPTYLKYYIDGRLTYTVTDPTMIPSKPMHATLQLNQACSTWVGCRDASTPKVVSMDVDYLRMFPKAP
jgi:beta-glucanase (GH16 family)